jgi:hypothetical protein
MKTNPYADPHHEKHEAYNAATALLAKQDEGILRYAALELRRCMEAIVYENLRIYGDLLPEGSVHQWQPPQAFDALIGIEPDAEATVTYAIAPETEPGKMATGPYHAVGVDERPKAKWIKKTWQKLGSYLHADWPFAVHNSSFSAMLSTNINFTCVGCGAPVKVMEKAVESSREAACLICGMPYRFEKSDGRFSFIPGRPPFTCECGAATFVPPKQIKEGYKFACRSCNRNFQVVGFDWHYVPIEEGAGDSGL